MQIDKCRCFVDPNLIKNKKYCEFGDLLVACTSVNKDSVGKAVAYVGNEKPFIGDEIRLVRHKQNSKFLAYMFSSKYIRKQIEGITKPTTVFHIYSAQLKKIKIPLPPLEEQEKIVATLDKLHENIHDLSIKIQKLMSQREKQYTFNSSKILSAI